jgi:hypothetical protein
MVVAADVETDRRLGGRRPDQRQRRIAEARRHARYDVQDVVEQAVVGDRLVVQRDERLIAGVRRRKQAGRRGAHL